MSHRDNRGFTGEHTDGSLFTTATWTSAVTSVWTLVYMSKKNIEFFSH